MKRKLSIFLSAIILFTNVIPVFANNLETNDKLQKIEFEIIEIEDFPTNKDVELEIIAIDELSGIKSLYLSGESEVMIDLTGENLTKKGKYIVSNNGIYDFIAEDLSGNKKGSRIQVLNIDRVNPLLSLSLSSNESTNEGITVIVEVSDDHTGVDYVLVPGNIQEIPNEDGKVKFLVTENGTYNFTVFDKAGNKATDEIIITNVDLQDKIKEIEDDIKNLEDLKDAPDIQDKIDDLPKGDDKDRLQNDLDEKIKEIENQNQNEEEKENDAINAVDKAEKDVNIVENNPIKNNKDEAQKSIDTAKYKVNNLENIDLKEELNNKLDELQDRLNKIIKDLQDKIRDIENDIKNLEDLKDAPNIQDKINNLPEDDDKDRLQNDLDEKIKEIESQNENQNEEEKENDAKDAVDKAEKDVNIVENNPTKNNKNEAQKSIDKAKDKVDNLENLKLKEELSNKLDELQDRLNKIIEDLQDKIKEIENDIKNLEDLKDAPNIQDKIDNLPEGDDKDRLQNDLNDKIKEIENQNENQNEEEKENDARESVNKAEKDVNTAENNPLENNKNEAQKSIDRAKDKVNNLENIDLKEELNNKLDELQDRLNKIISEELEEPQRPQRPQRPRPSRPRPQRPTFNDSSEEDNKIELEKEYKKNYENIYQNFIIQLPYTILLGEDLPTINGVKTTFDNNKIGIQEFEIDIMNTKTKHKIEVVNLINNNNAIKKVPSKHWGTNEIINVINKGYIQGSINGDLMLNDTLTIADSFVAYNRLLLAKNIKQDFLGRTIVDDKIDLHDQWYSYGVKSILNRYSKEDLNSFEIGNPGRAITREEIAQIIYNSLGTKLKQIKPMINYDDLNLSNNKQAIEFVTKTGLFVGYDNNVNPKGILTRAEFMAILNRLDISIK